MEILTNRKRLQRIFENSRTVALLILSGCATQGLQVSSVPEGADVYIVSASRGRQEVGKTPIQLDSRNTPGLFDNVVEVQISRTGFQTQSTLVPKMSLGGTGTLHAILQESSLPKVCQSQEDSFNEMARGVAEASNLIQRKSYSEASSLVNQLIARYGTVSVLHDLQGNIFYLQKDLQKALEAYRKSNALSPNNPSTVRMIQKLEKLQGLSGGV